MAKTLYGTCKIAGRCLDTCGLCARIPRPGYQEVRGRPAKRKAPDSARYGEPVELDASKQTLTLEAEHYCAWVGDGPCPLHGISRENQNRY